MAACFYSVMSHIEMLCLSIPTDCQLDAEELWEDEDHESELLDNESKLLDDESKDVPPELPCNNSPASDDVPGHAIVMWLVRFLVLLQARHYIPDAAINSLLKFLRVLFVVLGRFSTFVASVASSIPSSVHMLKKHLNQHGSLVKCCLSKVSSAVQL